MIIDSKTIKETIQKHNIKFVKLMFVDVLGVLKTVEIPASNIETALNNKIMIDGSSIRGFATIDYADRLLAPDVSSFRVLPLLGLDTCATAMFMCDILLPSGEISPMCTRSNLKRVASSSIRSAGISVINVGFEPEFMLLKGTPTVGNYKECLANLGGYCDNDVVDSLSHIRREIMTAMHEVGLKPSTSHHECAPSQCEVNYQYGDALTACDNILIAKLIVKSIARRHGLVATFMPRPIQGVAGNGLHTNISLRAANGDNVFASTDNSGDISSRAKMFVSGILEHAKALAFVTNPTINSYKRLVKGHEAPVNVCYSYANRSAMIRIPSSSGSASRIEVRSVDSSSNPYLAIAGLIVAGMSGLKKGSEAKLASGNIYKDSCGLECLPSSLQASLDAFVADDVINTSISKELKDYLISYKRDEITRYFDTVNSFDIDNYFDI